MDYLLFALVLLILYVARDSELLRMSPTGPVWRRIAVYGLCLGMAVILTATLAIRLGLHPNLRPIRHPAIIKPLLLLQLIIWYYYGWVRRAGDLHRVWTIAVIPSPVLVLCLAGLVVHLHHVWTEWPIAVLAVVVAGTWIGALSAWMSWNARTTGQDPAWGLGFAGLSNALIILLLPLEDIAAEARDIVRWLGTAFE